MGVNSETKGVPGRQEIVTPLSSPWYTRTCGHHRPGCGVQTRLNTSAHLGFFLEIRHLFANLLSFGRCFSVVGCTPHRGGCVALVRDIGIACVAGTQARPVAQAP